MQRWSWKTLGTTVGLSALAWGVVAVACLMVGSSGAVGWPTASTWLIRQELVLMASLVGAALASAGVVYQAVLRNPLADPYLLGVSSGASLAAYVWRLPALAGGVSVLNEVAAALGQQGAAFVGALISIGIVFALAGRRGRLEPITLVLVGVIVNAFCGSLFLLIHALTMGLAASGGELTFLVGGLQTSLTSQQKISATIVVGAGWLVMLYISGKLNVASLGEAEAESLGVRVNRLRWVALITASLVTASVVAISGPIGFVGLVCPHLARLLVGNDTRRLLPVATALGASLLAIADAVSRLLARESMVQTWLQVGVLTGLLGAPFFLFLLWKSTRDRSLAVEQP